MKTVNKKTKQTTVTIGHHKRGSHIELHFENSRKQPSIILC